MFLVEQGSLRLCITVHSPEGPCLARWRRRRQLQHQICWIREVSLASVEQALEDWILFTRATGPSRLPPSQHSPRTGALGQRPPRLRRCTSRCAAAPSSRRWSHAKRDALSVLAPFLACRRDESSTQIQLELLLRNSLGAFSEASGDCDKCHPCQTRTLLRSVKRVGKSDSFSRRTDHTRRFECSRQITVAIEKR